MTNIIVFSIALILSCTRVFGLDSLNYLDQDAKAFENSQEMQVYRKKHDQLKADLLNGKMGERANKAIDNIIITTVGELKKRGHRSLALQIESDWKIYYGFTNELDLIPARDVGDHPGIKFLLSIHEKVHAVLGDVICSAIRTHDLFILAHTIPVVFRCVDNVNDTEYFRHFAPFAKVVSYWLTYGICVGASMGTGVMGFCGLIGMVVEQSLGNAIGFAFASQMYGLVCKNQVVHPIGH